MTDSEEDSTQTLEARDALLGRFQNLTFKIEAALDHDDVAEVAFLLSRREEVLNDLQLATARHPLSEGVVKELQERDAALRSRLETAQEGLTAEAGSARAMGKVARSYVKNS